MIEYFKSRPIRILIILFLVVVVATPYLYLHFSSPSILNNPHNNVSTNRKPRRIVFKAENFNDFGDELENITKNMSYDDLFKSCYNFMIYPLPEDFYLGAFYGYGEVDGLYDEQRQYIQNWPKDSVFFWCTETCERVERIQIEWGKGKSLPKNGMGIICIKKKRKSHFID